jgi:AraC-like DNA-binding protein
LEQRKQLVFQRFSDADFEPERRHDAFVSRNIPKLYELSPLTPFYFDSALVQIGRLTIVYIDIAGQRWFRGSAQLRTAPGDDLCINASLGIHARGIAGERSFHQTPGSAAFTDMAQASVHESTGGRSIQMIIPRPVATGAGLDVAELHGLVLRPGIAQMLTSHLLHLREAAHYLSLDDGPQMERTIMDILHLAIAATGRADQLESRVLASAGMERVQHEIRQNLGSSLLTATNLCRKLGISRSSLHRMFEEHGGVQAYIRNARLDAARLKLTGAGGMARIVDIAERLGFADAAHFSRSFRERFGETPSEFRKNIDGGPMP